MRDLAPRVSLSILAGLSLLACTTGNAPAPPADPSPSATAARAADASPITAARRLALVKPGGASVIDREVERWQASVGKGGETADVWVALGRAWVKKAREASDPGFYLNARAAADVALDMAPGYRPAQNLLGLVLLNDHKFDEARDLAGQLLAKAPEDLLALGTLSDAHLETGRYDEATQAAEKMVHLKPNLPSYLRVSHLAWLRGDERVAIESARLAIDAGMDPKDPEPRCWALVHAATLFWHRGDARGADAGYKEALRACSDYPPALAGRGRVALAEGDPARAIEHLARAYEQSPLVEHAWLLGDARAAAGDARGAEEAYALAEKRGRQSDGRSLALFYATKDRAHDEAVRLAEAERRARDDLYTEDTLAWALYRAGKIAEAREASDEARRLGTRDARILYHAGAIRIAAGDRAGGEKLVEEALRQNPHFDFTGAAEARKLLGR